MIRTVTLALAATLACSPTATWSKSPREPADAQVTLRIDARHRMTLAGTRTSGRALMTALSRITGGDHERPIIVQSDSEVRFGEVQALLHRLEEAGYTRLMLLQSDAKGAAQP